MNRSPDVELVLRDYLADDSLTAPDYILDVVESRISRQPQRPSWRLPWRNPMSTPFKLAAGLAAVVLVALVAWQLMPGRQDGIGGPPSPTPTLQPSATPVPSSLASAAPSTSVACPQWLTTGCVDGAGILSAGSHTTRAFNPGFTFSVPDGWVNEYDERNYFALFPDTPANQAEYERSESVAQSMILGPQNDPYFFCQSVENNQGATAADIAAAAAGDESLAMTGLVDVAIGGLTGKQFDVRVNPEWTGTCPPGPNDPPGLDFSDERTRVILLDTPDRRVLLMLIYSKTSAESEAFLAEVMPIVESFQFDL